MMTFNKRPISVLKLTKLSLYLVVPLFIAACYGQRSAALSSDKYTGQNVILEDKLYDIRELIGVLEDENGLDITLETNLSLEELANYKFNILEIMRSVNNQWNDIYDLPLKVYEVLDLLNSHYTYKNNEKYIIYGWNQQYKRRLNLRFTEWVDPD